MSRRPPTHHSKGHSSDAISSAALLDWIVEAGIPDRADAERALRLTLSVLGQRLTDDEALALTACLPEDLARAVEQSEYSDYDGAFDATEFYERVRRREKTPPGMGREHVNVVLQAIGRALEDDVRQRLVRALPEAIGRQLLPPELGEPPPHASPSHAPRLSTLACGRAGSHHPIAEAAALRGHTHSVARNEDPHGETKLSSSRGLTQERLDESLAMGRPPGPTRPVAEAGDE